MWYTIPLFNKYRLHISSNVDRLGRKLAVNEIVSFHDFQMFDRLQIETINAIRNKKMKYLSSIQIDTKRCSIST